MQVLNNLHAHGVYHRDLKPQNIIVTVFCPTVKLKFVDWGSSRHKLQGKA